MAKVPTNLYDRDKIHRYERVTVHTRWLDRDRSNRDVTVIRTILALLGAILLGAAALPPVSSPALASDTWGDGMMLAADRVAPPKGRLQKRKSISDPSLAPPRETRRYGRKAFRWFWEQVSPSRAAANANRWSQVITVIENGRRSGKAVFGSTSTARRILRDYGAYLKKEAKRRNLSLPFLVAVIAVESNGNPKARSHAGAGGLMQLMPFTAARFGVSNAYAPSQNIRGGAQYLDWLLKRYRNDAVLALAGYNAGEGAVDRFKGVPPYNETRDYVAKVAGAYAAARALCRTPPTSARGTCELK